jgi:hypothetical protein
VTDLINTRGIDLDHVTVGGQPLLTDGGLNPHIHHSALRTVGTLEKLSVSGDITVGSAASAVTIGDRQGTARIASGNQPLVLGTAQTNHITLGIDGVTVIDQLQVGKTKIGFAAQVPGHKGHR